MPRGGGVVVAARKQGTSTPRRTKSTIAAMEAGAAGLSPVEYLLAIMRDEQLDLPTRHRDRRLVRQSEGKCDFDGRSALGFPDCGGPNPVDPYGAGDVLEGLLAQILEREVELTRHVLLHPSRHTDPTGFSQAFEASRDIYSIAENVAVLNDNIANINAHSKFDAFLGGVLCIALGRGVLNLRCTPHGIDDTCELSQQTVPGSFDDASSMFANLRVDHVGADRSQSVESTFLICTNEPRVARHVGG